MILWTTKSFGAHGILVVYKWLCKLSRQILTRHWTNLKHNYFVLKKIFDSDSMKCPVYPVSFWSGTADLVCEEINKLGYWNVPISRQQVIGWRTTNGCSTHSPRVLDMTGQQILNARGSDCTKSVELCKAVSPNVEKVSTRSYNSDSLSPTQAATNQWINLLTVLGIQLMLTGKIEYRTVVLRFKDF